jgi:hypothetical protein
MTIEYKIIKSAKQLQEHLEAHGYSEVVLLHNGVKSTRDFFLADGKFQEEDSSFNLWSYSNYELTKVYGEYFEKNSFLIANYN